MVVVVVGLVATEVLVQEGRLQPLQLLLGLEHLTALQVALVVERLAVQLERQDSSASHLQVV
jgi:hypothetical protein